MCHALLKAYIKRLLNDWMGEFYDVGGAAAEVGSGDTAQLEERANRIRELLLQFCVLCIPSVFIHPIFKLVTNRWVLSWRLSLVKSYLSRWQPASTNIENAAQRIHEDTGRFARGLQTCAVVVLDSVLTIGVFAPILVELGSEIQPIDLPGSWVLLLCIATALAGFVVSMALGWRLIALEVDNQKVEAELRKALVLKEEGGTHDFAEPTVHRDSAFVDAHITDLRQGLVHTIRDLRSNYIKLYNMFSMFSAWLGFFEQAVVVLPYTITAPLLYASHGRITLGLVTKTSHSFSNVFDAMNVLSDRWIDVTEFLSCTRRLREFEAQLASTSTRATLMTGVEVSSTEGIVPDRC